jgi:acyl carrier protein
MNESEEIKIPTLSLEALRTIGRIVQAIKNRRELDAGSTE